MKSKEYGLKLLVPLILGFLLIFGAMAVSESGVADPEDGSYPSGIVSVDKIPEGHVSSSYNDNGIGFLEENDGSYPS